MKMEFTDSLTECKLAIITVLSAMTVFVKTPRTRAPYQPHSHMAALHRRNLHAKDTFCGDLHAFTSYLNSIHPTPLSLHPIIHLHLYPFLMLTFLSITAISRLTFTPKPQTNINTYYILPVILNIPKELFHSA